jgi:hypothetical protein
MHLVTPSDTRGLFSGLYQYLNIHASEMYFRGCLVALCGAILSLQSLCKMNEEVGHHLISKVSWHSLYMQSLGLTVPETVGPCMSELWTLREL